MAYIENWSLEGYWQDGDYFEPTDDELDDLDYGEMDAMVVHVELSNGSDMYLTIHGAEDYDSLDDLVEYAVDGYEES